MEDNLQLQEVGEASSPGERDGFVRVVVDLPQSKDDPEWPLADRERLWAEALGDDRYRIQNIPFYVRGLNFGDVVRARRRSDSAELHYDEVVEWNAHSTYRVIVATELNPEQHAAFHALLDTIVGFGCSTEKGGPIFFAIDVPPTASEHAVYDALKIGADEGVWSFEGAAYDSAIK